MEIAYRLHFDEPTHFGALFKKMTQLTPGQYRESVRQQAGGGLD